MPRPFPPAAVSRLHEVRRLTAVSQPFQSFAQSSRRVWRDFSESVSNDREILVLTGVLVALALWFAVTGGPESEPAGAREAPRAYAEAPVFKSDAGTFDYVPDGAKTLKIPSLAPGTSEDPLPPPETANPPGAAAATVPPPVPTASIEAHALLADPQFDPLGAAV